MATKTVTGIRLSAVSSLTLAGRYRAVAAPVPAVWLPPTPSSACCPVGRGGAGRWPRFFFRPSAYSPVCLCMCVCITSAASPTRKRNCLFRCGGGACDMGVLPEGAVGSWLVAPRSSPAVSRAWTSSAFVTTQKWAARLYERVLSKL